jgi:hypothetical protein
VIDVWVGPAELVELLETWLVFPVPTVTFPDAFVRNPLLITS